MQEERPRSSYRALGPNAAPVMPRGTHASSLRAYSLGSLNPRTMSLADLRQEYSLAGLLGKPKPPKS